MKVCHSTAHLLLSVMTTVRPSYLLHLQTIQTVYNDVSQGSIADLPYEVRVNQCAVVNAGGREGETLPYPSKVTHC